MGLSGSISGLSGFTNGLSGARTRLPFKIHSKVMLLSKTFVLVDLVCPGQFKNGFILLEMETEGRSVLCGLGLSLEWFRLEPNWI